MITEVEVDSFLEHHGVKGMRWGVRRGGDGGSSQGKQTKGGKFLQDHKQGIKRGASVAVVAGSAAVIAGGFYLKHRANTKLKAANLPKSFVESGKVFSARDAKGNVILEFGDAFKAPLGHPPSKVTPPPHPFVKTNKAMADFITNQSKYRGGR